MVYREPVLLLLLVRSSLLLSQSHFSYVGDLVPAAPAAAMDSFEGRLRLADLMMTASEAETEAGSESDDCALPLSKSGSAFITWTEIRSLS